MNHRPFDLGEGTVHVVEPGEALRLAPRLLDAVPERMRAAWPDVAGTLRRWADAAPSEPFARWLEAAADAECSLEVYDTRDFPLRAFLTFGFGDIETEHCGTVAWRVLVDCRGDAVGGTVPEPLAFVHATIGGLCTQWGCSGWLVSSPDLRTKRGWTTIFEVDGDELQIDRAGAARWRGHEWGDPSELPATLTVADCVDDLFTTLARKEYFHMAAQRSLRGPA